MANAAPVPTTPGSRRCGYGRGYAAAGPAAKKTLCAANAANTSRTGQTSGTTRGWWGGGSEDIASMETHSRIAATAAADAGAEIEEGRFGEHTLHTLIPDRAGDIGRHPGGGSFLSPHFNGWEAYVSYGGRHDLHDFRGLPTTSGRSSEVVGNRSRDDFPPVTIGNRGGSRAREIVGGSRKARKGNAGKRPEAVLQESGRQGVSVGRGSARARAALAWRR